MNKLNDFVFATSLSSIPFDMRQNMKKKIFTFRIILGAINAMQRQ